MKEEKIKVSPKPCAFCGTPSALEAIDLSGASCGRLNGETCSACKEIHDLDKEIQHVLDSLQQLVRQRCDLKTKRNRHHAQLVNNLPPEILSHIFVFYQSYSYKQPQPTTKSVRPLQAPNKLSQSMVTSMLLGSVCRRWREIAETTPRLWTSISVNAHRSDMEEYAPFVAACLSRSRALPLTLAIYDRKDDYAPKAPDHNKDLVEPHKEAAPIIKVVNANSSRWKSLSVFVPISVLRQLWCDSRRAPALETVCIHAFPSDPNADFLIFSEHKTCIPSPKSLLLSSIRPHMIHIRWDKVENVDLDNVSQLDVRAMFSSAPKMTSFSIRSLHHGARNLSFDPITLHALRRLNLTTCGNIDELLNSVTVPSLQALSVMSLSPSVTSMVSRSRPPLTHLTISAISITDDALTLFKETPLLTHLRLIDVLLPTNFFRLLSTTSTRAATDSEAFLPALSSLTISTALEPDWTDVADMLDTEGVEAVHATRRPLSRFVFRLIGGKLHRDSDSDEGANPTDSPTLQRLRALKDSGLFLLIMDGRGRDLLAKGRKYIGLDDDEDE